jgi:hypothetical protein
LNGRRGAGRGELMAAETETLLFHVQTSFNHNINSHQNTTHAAYKTLVHTCLNYLRDTIQGNIA